MSERKVVYFDARHLNSGIGTYIHGLLDEYHKMDLEFDFHLIGNKEVLAKRYPRFKVTHCTTPIYTVREQIEMPFLCRKADLLHVPHYNIPLAYSGRLVTTIHDLAHLNPADTVSGKFKRTYARFLMNSAIRKSRYLISGTNSTATEIQTSFGPMQEKLVAIHHGISKDFGKTPTPDQIGATLDRFSIRRKFCLYVGNLKPHKNVTNMIKAFVSIQQHPNSFFQLVLVGKAYGDSSCILPHNKNVVYLGTCGNTDLRCLYEAAGVLILLSFNEGFGLPLVEAMASNTAILASDIPVLREVGGNAAVYANPRSLEDITKQMRHILANEEFRNELALKGKSRATLFPWSKSAKCTLDVYRRCLTSRD